MAKMAKHAVSCPSPISIALSSARSSRASSLFWLKRSQDSFCPELRLCFPWGSITDAFAPMRCSRLCDERWVEREVELKHWKYSIYSNYSNSVFDSMLLSSHRSNSRTGYSTKVPQISCLGKPPWWSVMPCRQLWTHLLLVVASCCSCGICHIEKTDATRIQTKTVHHVQDATDWIFMNFLFGTLTRIEKKEAERATVAAPASKWTDFICQNFWYRHRQVSESLWISVMIRRIRDDLRLKSFKELPEVRWQPEVGTRRNSSELVGTRRNSSELVGTRRNSPSHRTRRGENRASGCSFFAILCGWRCGPVAILWSDNCSKIPGIFKVHFNDALVFTGETVFRARRFLWFISSAVFCSRRGLWQTSSHFCHCFAIATGKLLLLAAALGWLSHWSVCSNCYG